MRIALNTPAKKAVLLAPILLLVIIFIAASGASFLASLLSQRPSLASRKRAIWLQPANAELVYRAGLFLESKDVAPDADNSDTPLKYFRAAVALNPRRARYWLSLASAYALTRNSVRQQDAIAHAVIADPTNPEVAWEAANMYMSLGQNDEALQQFKIVMANDSLLTSPAIERSWRLMPNAGTLMSTILPRTTEAYLSFLALMMQQDRTKDAASTWAEIQSLNQPISQRAVLNYVQYLLARKNIEQAKLVWEQSATLAGLSDYQPSPENLVINGGFDLPVMNGGFDWLYVKPPHVSFALDTVQFHSAPRSLLISFDKAPIEEAGIQHLILTNPSSSYDFFASYKTESLQGAGGLVFTLQDAFDGSLVFTSDELTGADFWKEVTGSFTTGPASKLLLLRVRRIPAGNVIEGNLWIDDVRLTEHHVENSPEISSQNSQLNGSGHSGEHGSKQGPQ